MQKAVVFGSAGQLGLELVKEFRLRGYEVTPFNRASVDIAVAVDAERARGAEDEGLLSHFGPRFESDDVLVERGEDLGLVAVHVDVDLVDFHGSSPVVGSPGLTTAAYRHPTAALLTALCQERRAVSRGY